MIRVGIVEDNIRISRELKEKIELSPEFTVSFVASNGQEAIDLFRNGPPADIALIDIEMPLMNGIEATRKIVALYPDFPVVICSIYDDETSIMESIFAGASGYLLKEESPGFMHQALHQAMNGGSPLNPLIAKKTLEMLNVRKPQKDLLEEYRLTAREIEILQLLATGKSYDQIAGTLFISSGTARKHIENLYRKLNVTNKVDAIRKL